MSGVQPSTVFLVSCVARKRAEPAPARELYESAWFRKARAYVEAEGGRWFILSAEHGLLTPDRVVAPYERTLNTMGIADRRRWAQRVSEQLTALDIRADRIVVLAGLRYREFLMPALRQRAAVVDVPMEGLGIGQQLAWLDRNTVSRRRDLVRFYELLVELAQQQGGGQLLRACHGRQEWPVRGVYFFFEPGELCSDGGRGQRVVRVGTHALTQKSRATLWGRLAQHRGTTAGGGNHRGSIFRLLVGEAMQARSGSTAATWGLGSSVGAAVRKSGQSREALAAAEGPVEATVSRHLGATRVVVLDIDDAPSRDSLRGLIERHSIALLSNWDRPVLDSPSGSWLGASSPRDKVRLSGLWNQNHVDEHHDPAFLDVFAELIRGRMPARPAERLETSAPPGGSEPERPAPAPELVRAPPRPPQGTAVSAPTGPFAQLTLAHVHAAAAQIDREGVPPRRAARNTVALLGGREYPAKYLLGLAVQHATGQPLSSEAFSGGTATARVLVQVGVDVRHGQQVMRSGGAGAEPELADRAAQPGRPGGCSG